MYLVTKTIKCTGCNFSTVQDFLDWHAQYNGALFRQWVQGKQAAGQIIYINTNILGPDRVENIYLFQDAQAHSDYEAFLAAEPMASSIAAAQAAGVVIENVSTEDV